ncbi:2-amino-4-hydroxy-6-hydroxymethyldihydropteridine diphosphokinase [uncultured Bacteroides sp.]|uniref:2-amino-4-hydroxy-6- hydroxymethyldihydropteridine diphosphokinase n=1 Tax=uncultured Bacteroides sp. TaxID=162156 RepID=UPI00260E509E|nr:2-amino-4-hydroxy-6-hydroxymethyldihydropteridine diphosphokinase [uncultured Bacteroides sp.]
MRDKHCCIICLGSNHESEAHLRQAKKILDERFEHIQWGKTVETTAEGECAKGIYLNRAAAISSELPLEDINKIFKEIELHLGRTAKSKSEGIIPIDIDILIFDHRILKPADMDKNYVKQALESIATIR